jgi:hypothetical protein
MPKVTMHLAGLAYGKDWISQPFEIIRKMGGEYLSFDNKLVQVSPYWQDCRVDIFKALLKQGFDMTHDKDLRDMFFEYIENECRKLRP